MQKLITSLFWVSLFIGLGCSPKTYPQKQPIVFKPGVYTIKNKNLSVAVKTHGAELTGIKSPKHEYLWQGNPEYWKGQAPILFPIIGKLKDFEYIYQGKTYKMKPHGFARNSEFEVVKKTDNLITLRLTATDKTRAIYPFDFDLQITYKVVGHQVIVTFNVLNPSATQNLYFSIGAHPAFNCPLEPNQNRNEYQLVFDKKISPAAHINNAQKLDAGQTIQVFSRPGIIDISDTLFRKKAFTIAPNPFTEVNLIHQPTQKKYWRISLKDIPELKIWSRGKSPFICIEPLNGSVDKADHNKELTQKAGIIKLPPKETFKSSFKIEIFE